MPLELLWQNLWTLALPFFICISTAAFFTVLLWRVAWKSGLPHRREPCATCVFEPGLLTRGTCREVCAVNVIPTLPLLLFLFTASFALLFLFFPSLVFSYLFPGDVSGNWANAAFVVVAGSNAGAAILLTGYFVQDKAWHRELFFRVAVAGSLVAIVTGLVAPAWLGSFAETLVPVGLVSVLLSASLEHRAQWGRPVLGMRALGMSTLPLFLVAFVAMARILFVLSAAYPQL